jgi:hypothetical protein
MANMTELARHNQERGLILKYLVLAGPKGATFGELRRYLRLMNRPVTKEGLEFHLRSYLWPKGHITLVEGTEDPDGPRIIQLVQIAPAGIDRVDRRGEGDDGITL